MQPIHVNRKGIAQTENAPMFDTREDRTTFSHPHEKVGGSCKQPCFTARNLNYGCGRADTSLSADDMFDQFIGAVVLPALVAGLMVLLAVIV